MNKQEFPEVLKAIQQTDERYKEGAYWFVRYALDHTIKNLKEGSPSRPKKNNHVSGKQLLNGIRNFAIDQYGPMAKTLLDSWRIQQCEDLGEIVFNLVEHGILGKTDEDSRDDFAGGYDFHEAFVDPFLPKSRRGRGSSADNFPENN